ncbi:hypothetical protein M8J77_009492 [Diaphorina citri]|nr:hypothetical protein M8J77_009492 [Diaphorina citri]
MKSTLVLLFTSTVLCYQAPAPEQYSGARGNGPLWNRFTHPSPQFEATPSSILAHVGQNVTLPCRVRNLVEQTVSWIRTSELSILTSNIFTFTSDDRFSVEHPDGDSAAWGLRVSGVRLEDAGEYECQVSTFPKLRHTVRLTVKDTSMNSDGFEENILRDSPPSSADLRDLLLLKPTHVEATLGMVTTLTCTVELGDDSLAMSGEKDYPTIRWRHNGTALNFRDHSRSGGRSRYSVESEISADRILSRLVIANVDQEDAGVYECTFNEQTAESELRITEGRSEALSVNKGCSIHLHSSSSCFIISCVLLLYKISLVFENTQ